MRELKFRAWAVKKQEFVNDIIHEGEEWLEYEGYETLSMMEFFDGDEFVIEQYTGLKDKNGKEIYENCELDGRYIVKYIAPCFVGRDIVNGDIIELYDNKFTITKEHSELSQNSKRGFD